MPKSISIEEETYKEAKERKSTMNHKASRTLMVSAWIPLRDPCAEANWSLVGIPAVPLLAGQSLAGCLTFFLFIKGESDTCYQGLS